MQRIHVRPVNGGIKGLLAFHDRLVAKRGEAVRVGVALYYGRRSVHSDRRLKPAERIRRICAEKVFRPGIDAVAVRIRFRNRLVVPCRARATGEIFIKPNVFHRNFSCRSLGRHYGQISRPGKSEGAASVIAHHTDDAISDSLFDIKLERRDIGCFIILIGKHLPIVQRKRVADVDRDECRINKTAAGALRLQRHRPTPGCRP